jgi:mannose-6-phosphate isomerase
MPKGVNAYLKMDRTNHQLLYPLLFKPVLKDYIWGGRNLQRILGRELPDGNIAESWEIAAHDDGVTIVRNGPLAGMSLFELHRKLGLSLIGRRNQWAQERDKFPLLIKLLDAHDKLSVQVHPGDEYALAHEGNELGKTEMWVILHAEPDSAIILGVRQNTNPELFRQAIHDGSLESYLHRLSIKAGDYVCVPSGTVHAILGGALIAEIQQNSNTTYRLYDWGRRMPDSSVRSLHVDQALDVIDFNQVEPSLQPPSPLPANLKDSNGIQCWLLCKNQYFTTERIILAAGSVYRGNCNGQSLEIWGVLEGELSINKVNLRAVQFSLLPAALGPFEIKSVSGATCLRVYSDE